MAALRRSTKEHRMATEDAIQSFAKYLSDLLRLGLVSVNYIMDLNANLLSISIHLLYSKYLKLTSLFCVLLWQFSYF